jgi:membrane protein
MGKRKAPEQVSDALPLFEVPDFSPEARRKAALRRALNFEGLGFARSQARMSIVANAVKIARRVWFGVINDGTIHAGNFAYMVLVALFPFFITGAALFALLGEPGQSAAAVNAVLLALPPVVADGLDPIAQGVITARTGSLLWIGGIVGLWTVGSLIETIREILRRAYGTPWSHGFWRHRLISTALTIAAVVLILISITADFAIGAAQEVILAWMPQFNTWLIGLSLSRFVPAAAFFGSLWLLFISLTPGAYRAKRYPKWPGALLVTGWWLLVTTLLPKLLRNLFAYDLTYGSLAGVMIALFFFWLVGLGVVVGAEFNAALAETPEEQDIMSDAS